jgi:hypothetical protein
MVIRPETGDDHHVFNHLPLPFSQFHDYIRILRQSEKWTGKGKNKY